jgi:hypothetical protein
MTQLARRVHLVSTPMPPPTQQEALFREGRHTLASHDYKQGKFQSINAAAEAFDVPPSTLHTRIHGVKPKRGSIAKNRLLKPTEEEVLEQWILSMDRRGMPPRIATVRQMAGLLASQYGRQITVGVNWPRTFIDCYDTLKSKYNQKYDYKRALCEDPHLIRAWFQRIQQTIVEWGILEEDIYNFDETGF